MLLLEDVVAEAAGHRILDGAHLAVRRGERYAVLAAGPAERRVLVELLTGNRAPQRGRVRVDGLDPVRDAEELAGRVATEPDADAEVLLLELVASDGSDAGLHLENRARLAAPGRTVLVLTSSPAVARRLCQRCAVLSSGLIHPLGPG